MVRQPIKLSIHEQALIVDEVSGAEWELVAYEYQYQEKNSANNLYICRHPIYGLYGFIGRYSDGFVTDYWDAEPLYPLIANEVVKIEYAREDGKAFFDCQDIDQQI